MQGISTGIPVRIVTVNRSREGHIVRLTTEQQHYLYDLVKADIVRTMTGDAEAIARDHPTSNPLQLAIRLLEAAYVEVPTDADLGAPTYLEDRCGNVYSDGTISVSCNLEAGHDPHHHVGMHGDTLYTW